MADALLRGNDVAALALASNAGDDAIGYLVKAAISGNSVAAPALVLAGDTGQSRLAANLQSIPDGALQLPLLAEAIRKTKVGGLVYRLLGVAMNNRLTERTRIWACRLLAKTALEGRVAVPNLRDLGRQADTALGKAAQEAISEITGDEAGSEYLWQVDSDARVYRHAYIQIGLEGLARMPRSRSEGLTTAVNDRSYRLDWSDRFRAIRTIGWIGDRKAVPFLIDQMRTNDWRNVLAAARALSRLGTLAANSIDILQFVSQHHWLPKIRSQAKAARERIVAGAEPAKIDSIYQIRDEDRDDLNPSEALCARDTRDLRAKWKFQSPRRFGDSTVGAHVSIHPNDLVLSYSILHGRLVGTDCEGHGNEGLTWLGQKESETLVQGSVHLLFPTPYALFVVFQPREAPDSGDVVAKIGRGASGWIVEPTAQLVGSGKAYRVREGGDIDILTSQGALHLSRLGIVDQFLPCENASVDEDRPDGQPP